VHNVVDGFDFLLIFYFFEVRGIQFGEEESDCCVFVLCGMVRNVKN
jgi:hypothetical protein